MKKLLTSSIIFSILLLTACSAQQSSEVTVTRFAKVTVTLPSPTETSKVYTVTATELVQPTPTVEKDIKLFQISKDFVEKDKMSTITLEDLQSGKLSKWELEQAKKMGPISNNPSDITYIVWHIKSVNQNELLMGAGGDGKHISGKDIDGTQFFSLYKINLGPWGFPDHEAFVATYIYLDKYGTLTPVHFFLPKKQAENDADIFRGTKVWRLAPTDVINYRARDHFLIDGKPGGPNDLRSIAETLYKNQGTSKEEVLALFNRIADSDTISESDKAEFMSILFFGYEFAVHLN